MTFLGRTILNITGNHIASAYENVTGVAFGDLSSITQSKLIAYAEARLRLLSDSLIERTVDDYIRLINSDLVGVEQSIDTQDPETTVSTGEAS